MTHRQLTNHQKAAHILIPVIAALVGELRTEAETTGQEASRPKASHDAMQDWREIAMRAEARAEGAARVLAMVKALAHG